MSDGSRSLLVTWLIRAAWVVGLLAFALAVWFAGPLIGFGETRPLDSVWIRLAIIGFVAAVVGAVQGFRWWRRRRAAKATEGAEEG